MFNFKTSQDNETFSVADENLTKLLAMENITIEYGDVPTAAFNTSTRTLILPHMKGVSKEMRHMLAVHETGHAIDTPTDTFSHGGKFAMNLKAKTLAETIVGAKGGWFAAISELADNVYGKAGKKVEDNHLKAAKSALNICEDVRIDKRQKRRYPGSRRDYRIGLTEMWDKDFFGFKKIGKPIEEYGFMDRVNIQYKGGDNVMKVPFSKEEKEFLARLDVAETFDDIKKLSEEMLRMAIEEAEQKGQQSPEDKEGQDGQGQGGGKKKVNVKVKKGQQGQESGGGGSGSGGAGGHSTGGAGEGEDDGDTEYEYEFEDGDESDEDSDGEGKGKGEGEKGEDDDADSDNGDGAGFDGDKDGDKSKSKQTSTGPKGGHSTAAKLNKAPTATPTAQTIEAMEDNLKKHQVASNLVYTALPEADLKKVVDDYKKWLDDQRKFFKGHYASNVPTMMKEVRNWKKEESPTIGYMVKEFEMRKAADIYSKIRESKTGVLNMNKVYTYKYAEDVFKRNSILPEGKNHGFVMFVDCSGSMDTQMDATVKQIASLAMFCKRIQVPFEVYLFRDGIYGSDYWKAASGTANPVTPNNFKLRNILSSRMNAAEMEEALAYCFKFHKVSGNPDPLGGTPLNEALIAANQVVIDFQRRTRVQIVNTIVLTDGHSNGLAMSVPAGRNRIVFKNLKTRSNHAMRAGDQAYNNYGMEVTSTLVRYLKENTKCTTVGMFIANSDRYGEVAGWMTPAVQRDAKIKALTQKEWTKDRFASVPGAGGYDEYFILQPMGSYASKGVFNAKGSEEEVADAFTQHMKKKAVNKVLINRLVSLIVNERKEKKNKNNS